MVKIVHYEVYADRGDGWKLVEQFSIEQRQEAVNLAKELERDDKAAVKIIREIFDVQDNTYQESVEYVSGLNRKNKPKISGNFPFSNNYGGEYDVEYEKINNEKSPSNSIVFALLKLVAIIFLCLAFANLLVSLLEPLIETFIPEDQRKKVLFIVFFAIFILITIPLILKKVPWGAFYGRNKRKKVINESRFFDKAAAIVRRYNLNDNFDDAITPVFPEAPLEHKRYIVDFLTEIMGSLDSEISLNDRFTKLGIKLVVYGGCMELSCYCGLVISEANSLLYEAYKILDGDNPDLAAFYEAKRSYKDNKVAVFLTGVGAYLMSQVIKGEEMDSSVLKITMKKWIKLNTQPEEEPQTASLPDILTDEAETPKTPQKTVPDKTVLFKCIVGIKTGINFYDDEKEISSETESVVRGEIRNIISNLVAKLDGGEVLEDDTITTIQFNKLNNAVKFTVDYLGDVENYKEQSEESGLLLDNKCCILEMSSTDDVNLSPYLADVFEQTYNNEIIVNDVIKDELTDSHYDFEYLGDKKLSRTGKTVALYKLQY